MKSIFPLSPSLTAAVLMILSTVLQADVTWRVSVKLIMSAGGQRPGTPAITDQEVQDQFDFANTNPYFAGRGVRFVLNEPVIQVTGAGQWFGLNLTSGSNKADLEDEARGDARYAWRNNAINIYLNDGTPGGSCSFPSGATDIIVIGADKTQSTPWVFIHETGHFMVLKHTHQGQSCGDDEELDCTDCPDLTLGNDDDITDTVADHQCGDQDDLAQGRYGQNYAALTSLQQENIDNTFFNIMSYHGNRSIFTTLQLDAMCDTSNIERDIVSHNDFVFIDTQAVGNGANGLSKSANNGTGGPFKFLKNGIDAASGGDVILIRPGNYTENRVIRQPITLRAVRRDGLVAGNAIIRAR